jgi:dihydrofolate reductase
MKISIIVAVAENGVIGGGNRLLWDLPADMRHFREKTKGHAVIMGRKTFESIGRPLPGRKNIVISRDAGKKIPGCTVVGSLDAAVKIAEDGGEMEAFVIGGGQIYTEALPQADRVYLTRVHATFEGDTFFPELSPQEWEEASREEIPASNETPHALTFLTYERRKRT